MTEPVLDRELLAAFLPEFEAELARLAAAPDAAVAGRALQGLRGMADALELTAFAAEFEAAEAAIDPFDAAAIDRAARALDARLRTFIGDPEPRALAAALSVSETGPALPATGPIRALVVDDSPTMRRLVAEVLRQDPAFRVVGEAADGEQALVLMRRLAPDLVLLDLEMPALDGLGVLTRWALEGGAGAIIVVSSAAPPGSGLARELRRLGAAAVIGKPSGALSFDLVERRGAALLATARRAAGLPPLPAPRDPTPVPAPG